MQRLSIKWLFIKFLEIRTSSMKTEERSSLTSKKIRQLLLVFRSITITFNVFTRTAKWYLTNVKTYIGRQN